ncbi:MAG: PAS domain S-box protein, partial [Candidatus Hydrothermarchaeales archaeon]
MMCVDLDSRFEFWNTGAEALFGFKRDEILGKNFHIIVPPELREAAEVKRRLALKKGFVRYETLRLKKDGTTVPVDMTLTVIADERGNPTGIAASIKDLSEKAVAESELREIKNHLESIFDTIQESICVIDKDLRIISFNESFAKNTGTPRENILGNKCYKVLHGYSEDEFLVHCRKHCIVREAFETGKPVESVHHHDTVEGQIFHESRALPTRNANGETYQIVYGINDVTEKKEAEQTLRFLAKIQGQVSEMIVTMALDHTLLTVNDAAQRTFGYSEDELVGQNASILVPEEEMENSNAFWDAISEKGFVEGYEGMRVTKNGRRFPTELSGVLVSGEGGASPYVIGVGRDITERKKAEKKLRDYADRLERSNKLKDLFADIMRHDLLNPLGVVKNVFEIIEEDLSDRGIEKEIAMVTRNVAKIEDLVHSAARFGQVESAEDMEFKNRNLKEILEEVVSGLSSEGLKKDMTIKIFQDDYYAETNPFIEDVFSNLITNAIKYSEAGSEIEASCEDLGDKLMISVSDRGMGVPDEHKQGIFERFKRVEKGSVKGSGLGLAIVKRVVELHNGDVWVEDRPDGGSTFAFTLPKKRDKDV